LIEDYERHCRGDSVNLRRTLEAWRRDGWSDARIVAKLEATVPHINRDGAEWTLESLIGVSIARKG